MYVHNTVLESGERSSLRLVHAIENVTNDQSIVGSRMPPD